MWDYEQVGARLLALSQQDAGLRRFGAAHHRYRMLPPLTEWQVRVFEGDHGVRLPEDYRDFIRTVGDGGAGPFYGILPLLGVRDRGREDEEELPLLADAFPPRQRVEPSRTGPRRFS